MSALRPFTWALVLGLLLLHSSAASALELWPLIESILGGILVALTLVWYVIGFIGIGVAQLFSNIFGRKRPNTLPRCFMRWTNLVLSPLSGIILTALVFSSGSGHYQHRSSAGGGGSFFLMLFGVLSGLVAYGLNLIYVKLNETGKREPWYQLSCGNWNF